MTHTTSDGKSFTDLAKAQAHEIKLKVPSLVDELVATGAIKKNAAKTLVLALLDLPTAAVQSLCFKIAGAPVQPTVVKKRGRKPKDAAPEGDSGETSAAPAAPAKKRGRKPKAAAEAPAAPAKKKPGRKPKAAAEAPAAPAKKRGRKPKAAAEAPAAPAKKRGRKPKAAAEAPAAPEAPAEDPAIGKVVPVPPPPFIPPAANVRQ